MKPIPHMTTNRMTQRKASLGRPNPSARPVNTSIRTLAIANKRDSDLLKGRTSKKFAR